MLEPAVSNHSIAGSNPDILSICGMFVELLLGAKFLHAYRGGGGFSNPNSNNKVPNCDYLEFGEILEKYPKLL